MTRVNNSFIIKVCFISSFSLLGKIGIYANQNPNYLIPKTHISANDKYILLEALSDDIIHIETAQGTLPNTPQPIYSSPMISKNLPYNGATEFQKSENKIETKSLSINVDKESLCISFFNKKLGYDLTTLCPTFNEKDNNSLKIISNQNKNAYGLGQYFYDPNFADGDWIGRKWEPGEFGNAFVGFAGGANSKVQFPILYALGNEKQNYALFIDSTYKMAWDFTRTDYWNVNLWEKQIRYFVIAGENIEDLRAKYISLVGNPTVPPKKLLGLWVSEYGFKNWNEIDNKLTSLRMNHFPVDGFALDLYWFGGTKGMGSLIFDENNFPNPKENIKNYKKKGIEFIPIQEPYISESALIPNSNINDFTDLVSRCYLVRKYAQGCAPSYFKNYWWGSGGMLDWSNEDASAYWYQKKQVPLVKLGITNFWLDLNEPEMYDPNAYYAGIKINGVLKNRHADIANLYALKWIESLDKGYELNKNQLEFSYRPYYMSRAGSPGMQRYGAGMWSGDIGSNLGGLKAHINTQMNVSLSGIDFYSADTGGFHRNVFDGKDIGRLYTMWFANATAFDFPVRPHTVVGETNNSETSPSLIGDITSNRENLLQRYALAPYYYSLFYRAHLFGEAVTPPLITFYQHDKNVRKISSEKMIGKFLLASAVFQYEDPIRRDIYLPEGRWLNFHTLDEVTKTGKVFIDFPTYLDGKYKIPLFVREGAIIPQTYVDEKTMDMQGLRLDGSKINDLIIKVVPSEKESSFVLYEDDGGSREYLAKNYAQTHISQFKSYNIAKVEISPTQGKYNGMPLTRKQQIEIAIPNESVAFVNLNGNLLEKCNNNLQENCWEVTFKNTARVKTSSLDISKKYIYEFSLQQNLADSVQYNFSCLNAKTVFGESIYIVGNIPELGNWNTAQAHKLFPVEYPTWTNYIAKISTQHKDIEWKCLKKKESTGEVVQWQAGQNNIFKTTRGGYGGNVEGRF
ncbi:TIM-barrel domain-containing protein [Fluviispira sanaruensis]|uniref:DUF5110 domain-containing protein n=1 Tax=Fluviispira sanaruensis TaxID=2493639 RepID=A0A4P2VKU6_FLUSA|nr:TIM-barrel domain-containing protein [Fluviispira sanaruensis]BBH51939.1 DUF5110 domain-containing protein [Fluviispira sanaruensis]